MSAAAWVLVGALIGAAAASEDRFAGAAAGALLGASAWVESRPRRASIDVKARRVA